jgi:crotonobetainyl-CoA:carnitine CoA-transferase CaiB-like acyl-CoA transferase
MGAWLSGYRAIDLTDERGLLAGQILAKLGVEVIQVEPPAGSPAREVPPFDAAGRSLFWSAYAAGKRGVTLDIEHPAGVEHLFHLLETSDFLLESADPGKMAALGLDWGTLHKRFPRLIHVSITAFGSEGPKRGYAATDLVAWAAGGALFPNRDASGCPLRISVPQIYLHGAADAVAGALVALMARLQSGRGQHVDISMQQSATQATLASHLAAAVNHEGFAILAGSKAPAKGKASLDLSGSGSRTRRSKWVVADGLVEMHLGMGSAAGVRTNNLFRWMKDADAVPAKYKDWDWRTVPDRILAGEIDNADMEEVRLLVARFLAPLKKADILKEALGRSISLAPVNTMTDLLNSEQLKVREFFQTVWEGKESRVLPGPFAKGPPGMFADPAGAPALGEHNETISDRRCNLAPADSPIAIDTGRGASGVGPLRGIKVADFAWVVAGPAIGRVLADYGATVVRVESSKRPDAARQIGPHHGGNFDLERCALYDTYNAGKLGLTLDLSTEGGCSVARDLAAWADIMIESFAPGQIARWGLDPDELRKANPGLIGVSTSLMGQTGPARKLAGFGNMGSALSGFFMLAGHKGQQPIGPYGPYTDFVGPRFGVVAVLAALEHRRRTGDGCWLDISQAEAGIQFLAPQVAAAAATGALPVADGNRDERFVPHGVFRCRDNDDWAAIVSRDDADWERLSGVIGGDALNPKWKAAASRKAHEDHIERLVEEWTRQHTATEVEDMLQAVRVPAHKVASSRDIIRDDQLAARGHFVRYAHLRGGESIVDASRYRLSETPAQYIRPAPCIGQDTHQVLSDLLGYSQEKIAALQEAGALR